MRGPVSFVYYFQLRTLRELLDLPISGTNPYTSVQIAKCSWTEAEICRFAHLKLNHYFKVLFVAINLAYLMHDSTAISLNNWFHYDRS